MAGGKLCFRVVHPSVCPSHLRVPLSVQRPAKTIPFQQIIMHALQCQHDVDVCLLFGFDLNLHVIVFLTFYAISNISRKKFWEYKQNIFSSAVPPGSGAFQMSTRPSVSASASASTLRGGRAHIIRRIWLNRSKGSFLKVKRSKWCPFGTLEHFLKNWSVTFSLFWHGSCQGWY